MVTGVGTENKSYDIFISLQYFQNLMCFNVKYINLHCANCLIFADIITSHCVTPNFLRILKTIYRHTTHRLLGFYREFVIRKRCIAQFAVSLCMQTLPAKRKLIVNTDDTGFVINL